jgi:hypothetical protein
MNELNYKKMARQLNTKLSLKASLILLLLAFPMTLSAHGEQVTIIIFNSIAYFLFFGLILGLIENIIFKKFSDSDIEVGRIILYNYLSLIIAYIVFVLLIYLTADSTEIPYNSANLLEDLKKQNLIDALKLLLSIFLYLLTLLGLKYLFFSKKILLKDSIPKKLMMIIIPNVIFFILIFSLIFNELVWFF